MVVFLLVAVFLSGLVLLLDWCFIVGGLIFGYSTGKFVLFDGVGTVLDGYLYLIVWDES